LTSLLLVLTSIALLDSTSMISISIVPIALILAGHKPFASACGFLLGILLAYFASGLLFMYGLDALLERIEPGLMRWWENPSAAQLLAQFILGIVMLGLARKITRSEGKPKQNDIQPSLSPSAWFSFGLALTLGGMPGAIPYLGAVDQIIRAQVSTGTGIAALAFYNLVFIVPLVLIFLVPRLFPKQSAAFFAKLSAFFETYGSTAIAIVLALLGLVFAIDAVSFYFGYPLLPVGDPGALP
jgi:cytochrome c biogenesis protein CcdA